MWSLLSDILKYLPVKGYHAAPFVIPFWNDGVLAELLHATPRDILAWLLAYTNERCLKTSSSGVRDGADAYEWNTEPKGHVELKNRKKKIKNEISSAIELHFLLRIE